MDNHAFYLTCAYGALALAIVWEIWAVVRQRRRVLETLRDHHDDSEQ